MPVQQYIDDAGTAISAEILSEKDFLLNIGDPDDIKDLEYLYVWATPISTMNVFIAFDGKAFTALGTVREYPQRFDLGHKKCSYIELKVTESSANKRFVLESYMIIGKKVPERAPPKP